MTATLKTILGIETSCDETSAAVVRWSNDADAPHGTILSNVVRSQWAEHAPYGGVVPEIAARAHAGCLDEIVEAALAEAGTTARDVDLIAATAGPGLIGGLLVGLSFAKALALGVGKPLIAVNHLEAHALTAGLTDGRRPPYLLLLVSGGHTQTVAVRGIGDYVRIGTTIDDALGEAFDKTAKLLGLPAPGGPAVEAAAQRGRTDAIALPRPMLGRAEPHFSLAGLKTAVRRAALERAPVTEQDIADICASFQAAVADIVADRLTAAIAVYEAMVGAQRDAAADSRTLVMAGGVAANAALRSEIERVAETRGYGVVAPPPALCTDNAAMIAWAAGERVAAGLSHDDRTVSARPRWPLDVDAAPRIGSGRLGAKA